MEIAMRQITFACPPSFEKFSRASRREQFLQTMESVVPWSELESLIAPFYPKAAIWMRYPSSSRLGRT
jgi:transposase, IS5 family